MVNMMCSTDVYWYEALRLGTVAPAQVPWRQKRMLKAVPKGFYNAYQYMCTAEQVFLANAVRIQKEIDLHGYHQLVRVSVLNIT